MQTITLKLRPKRNFFILIFLTTIFFTQTLFSQINFKDVYGNDLPTPSWPPPDSLYVDSVITIWFNDSVINDEYLCNYWDSYYNPPTIKDNREKLQDIGTFTGCFDVDENIITDSTLLAILLSFGAESMCQLSMFSPCEDTLSFTRWGDTIRTPAFWNCYKVKFNNNNIIDIIQYLLQFFGGSQIDYAELMAILQPDGNPPNDTRWDLQSNFYNDNQNNLGLYNENVQDAWDFEHGIREVKVAVVDDGIRYTHRDLGGNIGPNYRVVGGMEFPLRTLPSDGGGHGTPVAGLIGAMVKNEQDVAGIAGGWTNYEGVSLYSMKCPNFRADDLANAWIQAAGKTSGNKGFGVHVITNSNGSIYYDETRRRALDYAYRLGVSCFSSKGNNGKYEFRSPADYEYNKIVSVGNYGIFYNNEDERWVPSLSIAYGSNWGFGVDIMAQGDHSHADILRNCTLDDNGGLTWFSYTSAATPQVAGVGSLIISNYIRVPHINIDPPLYPEDVQGLLSISALDCNFNYSSTMKDTNGYDSRTGYGILKANKALEYMQNDYELRHFTAEGGTPGEVGIINDFVVLAPTQGQPLLEPSKYGVREYRAKRHTVRKEISLTGWEFARSWSLSGDGTVGWSGQLPVDGDANNNDNYQTGYCRVVGEGIPDDPDFNFNNIRDISWRNDRLILETYCYEVWNKANNDEYLGWYPTTPENVVYRYSIWGKKEGVGVDDNFLSNLNQYIDVRCETRRILGNNILLVHYKMNNPGSVDLLIFDLMGNQITAKKRDVWTLEEEQTISLNIENLQSGIYFVMLKSKNAAGTDKFSIIK